MNYNLSEMFGVKDEVTVITGSANGIGKEVALSMASLGAKVILIDISNDNLNITVNEFMKLGLTVDSYETDITKKDSVVATVNQIIEKYNKVDILINCAGVCYLEDAVDFDEKKWDWVMDVNVKGTMLTCQAFGKHMIKQQKGKIVNFSSVRGLQGRAKYLAYAPSKGAINMLTKSLATEWAKYNINVNAIAPAFTLTDLNKNMLKDDETYNWVISRIPTGSLGELKYMAGATVFLCSKAAEFINGHILYVDGGWTAS